MGRLPLEIVRKRKGISANKLAQLAGVSIATIRGIELGHVKIAPHYETMEKIATALQIGVEEISWPGNPYALEDEDN